MSRAVHDGSGLRPALVVFGHSRPDHLRRVLAALERLPALQALPVYIFVDGPASPADAPRVQPVREAAAAWHGGAARCTFHETNLGLARSIMAGVSRVLDEHAAVIVLEDDVVPGPAFLDFALAALARYRHRPRVMSISGYTPPLAARAVDPAYDAFFVPRSSSWGWATWRDRWRSVEWDPAFYRAWLARTERDRVHRCGDDLAAMADLQAVGLIDSWAYRWALAHLVQDRLALYPARSLVRTIGADGSGRHVRPTRRFDVEVWEPSRPLRLPDRIREDDAAAAAFRRTFDRGALSRARWWLKRRLRRRSTAGVGENRREPTFG